MSGKKEVIESSSLSTFMHTSDHPESTKKSISIEQISMEALHSQFQRDSLHYHFTLPFEMETKSLLAHLQNNLEQIGISILYCDQNAGQILVQKDPVKNNFYRFLDCLCIFRMEGWPKGSMFQTCEVVCLTIKRQFVDRKFVLGIKANYPKSKASSNLRNFTNDLMQKVKRFLQTYKGYEQKFQILQIDSESPLSLEINANKIIYDLVGGNPSDTRLKSLFEISVKKLKEEVDTMLKDIDNKKLIISKSIGKIIEESDSMFNFLVFSKSQITKTSHNDYILYSIENMLCYHIFPQIFDLYYKTTQQNCAAFRQNCQFINSNLSNKQYFDYLEVRPKFRLLNAQQPYHLAIDALRGLETALTLRQILLCVQKSFSLIKVCCLHEHSGKLQVSSMDDILPVMVYVVAKAKVDNFPAFVKIIDDYVRLRGVFELQERITTTLFVATQDIIRKKPKVIET